MAAIAVTGGAFGVAIGLGLKKIGSNMVSGLHLLISKPIRPGDIIALKGSIGGAGYGEISGMGLTYVRVITRDGTEQLLPNELFMVNRVENLSYSNSAFSYSHTRQHFLWRGCVKSELTCRRRCHGRRACVKLRGHDVWSRGLVTTASIWNFGSGSMIP